MSLAADLPPERDQYGRFASKPNPAVWAGSPAFERRLRQLMRVYRKQLGVLRRKSGIADHDLIYRAARLTTTAEFAAAEFAAGNAGIDADAVYHLESLAVRARNEMAARVKPQQKRSALGQILSAGVR
jgi:hypothetical protein